MAWWLVDSILKGTLDEDYPIMNKEKSHSYYDKDGGLHLRQDGFKVEGGHDPSYYEWDRNGLTENPFDDDYGQAVDHLVDEMPSAFTTLSDNDDAIAHHITTPTPGIEVDCPRKYKEDDAIKALQDYISTTYNGHYTSKENNVQTLDLIESVGDAESFCRSNAIKYLSRYDKKGQAKRHILKALHYSLLLYHFSGQLNETPTRGYETF